MGLRIKWYFVDCIYLAQDRDRGRAVLNMINDPSGSTEYGDFVK